MKLSERIRQLGFLTEILTKQSMPMNEVGSKTGAKKKQNNYLNEKNDHDKCFIR